MVFTALYNGKILTISVLAGNNSTIQSIDDVIVTLNVPNGIKYFSSSLPLAGTYDIENNIWNVGTIPPETTYNAGISFIVTEDYLNYIGNDQVEITWEISSPNVIVDGDPTNNTNSYTIFPAPCSEIESCIGCDYDKILYNCKAITTDVVITNPSTDILNDIVVNFTSPSGMYFKSAIATLGTVNLGVNSNNQLSTITISDGTCQGQYYQYLQWNIGTLPALGETTISLTYYVIDIEQLNNCDYISWNIVHDGILNGINGIIKEKGVSGSDYIDSIGYMEWSGRIYYSTNIDTIDSVIYFTNYKAASYNRNTVNYLGALTLTNVSPGVFRLTSNINAFVNNRLIMIMGNKSATSASLVSAEIIDSATLEFTVDDTVTTDIDFTANIKIYI